MKSFLIALKGHAKSELFSSIALESAVKAGWDVERFDAIDGRKLTPAELAKYQISISTAHKKFTKSFERPGVMGCFLSHYSLWKKCVELDQPIGIFEEDVIFLKPPVFDNVFTDVLKLEKKSQGKRYVSGDWWEGAYAYILTPLAAKKLITWTKINGALPADVMLGTEIVNIDFNFDQLVTLNLDSLANNNAMSTTQNKEF